MSKEELNETKLFFYQIFCPPINKSASGNENPINSKNTPFILKF